MKYKENFHFFMFLALSHLFFKLSYFSLSQYPVSEDSKLGCNISVCQNSFKIEQSKVRWLELISKIVSFSLHFVISPSNFKLLFLRTNLTYRVITPHSRKLRNSVWPFDHKLWAEDVRIISWNQYICKNKIGKFSWPPFMYKYVSSVCFLSSDFHLSEKAYKSKCLVFSN